MTAARANTRAGSRQADRAFTLVELLVVVAIVCLLLALLTPSLQRAKEAARTTICGSNLRQLGNAVSVYRSTYKNFYMPNTLKGSGSVFMWAGKRGAPGTGYDGYGADIRWINRFAGGPYKVDDEVPICHCPSDPWLYDYFGSSYASNNAHSTDARFPRSNLAKDDNKVHAGGALSGEKVQYPGLWVVAAEHGANHWAWDDPNRYMPGRPYTHHARESGSRLVDDASPFNLLFADGHAGLVLDVFVGVLNADAYRYDYR